MRHHYTEHYFNVGSKKLRLYPNMQSNGDVILSKARVFDKIYRTVDPSLVDVDKGCYFPLERRGKIISDKEGKILHCQINGTYDNLKGEGVPRDLYKLYPKKEISGTVLDLTSEGSALYSFWVLEALPKLKIVEDAVRLREDISVIVNAKTKFVLETLEAFGFSRASILQRNGSKCRFVCERLLVPRAIRLDRYTPLWALEYLRAKFGGGNLISNERKRIYISRQRSRGRRISNGDALAALLENKGFRTIYAEELSVLETVQELSGASCVISPHGAGLTNIVFAKKDALVIELFGAHYTTQYRLLSHELGQEYYAVACEIDGIGGYYNSRNQTKYDTEYLNRLDMIANLEVINRFLSKSLVCY